MIAGDCMEGCLPNRAASLSNADPFARARLCLFNTNQSLPVVYTANMQGETWLQFLACSTLNKFTTIKSLVTITCDFMLRQPSTVPKEMSLHNLLYKAWVNMWYRPYALSKYAACCDGLTQTDIPNKSSS